MYFLAILPSTHRDSLKQMNYLMEHTTRPRVTDISVGGGAAERTVPVGVCLEVGMCGDVDMCREAGLCPEVGLCLEMGVCQDMGRCRQWACAGM